MHATKLSTKYFKNDADRFATDRPLRTTGKNQTNGSPKLRMDDGIQTDAENLFKTQNWKALSKRRDR